VRRLSVKLTEQGLAWSTAPSIPSPRQRTSVLPTLRCILKARHPGVRDAYGAGSNTMAFRNGTRSADVTHGTAFIPMFVQW